MSNRWREIAYPFLFKRTAVRDEYVDAWLAEVAKMRGAWVVIPPGSGFQFIHADTPRDLKPRTALGSGLVPGSPVARRVPVGFAEDGRMAFRSVPR